jgi:dCTP diphosphatase
MRTGGRLPAPSASTTGSGTSIPVAVRPFVSSVARNRTPGGYPAILPAMSDLGELRQGMRKFVDERGWGGFHDPKSVLLALVGEVGELAELLQWLPADDVRELARDPALRQRLGEEMSDVLLYLVLLADVCGVDLPAAAQAKLADAQRRYPPPGPGQSVNSAR